MIRNIGIAGLTGFIFVGSYYFYTKPKFNNEKKNVILIGYGYAGRSFYNNIDKSKYNVKVLTGGNLTTIQPKFLDSLETNDKTKIIHKIDENHNDFNTCDKIQSIDTKEKKITVSNENETNEIKYDYLVMGIGHEVNTFGIEGVDKYCKFYTSYDDLEKLRQIADSSQSLKIGVVGASLAGLEIAGYLSDNHRVDIIEYASNILPTMKLDTQYNVHKLMENKKNINFLLDTQLLKVENNEHENKKISHTKTKNKISQFTSSKFDVYNIIHSQNEYDVIIWTAGVRSNSNMIKWLSTNKVNEQLQLENTECVYAIGDCNNTMPKSGQNAKSQGKYLAKLFNSNFDSNYKFQHSSLGTIIKLPNCVYIESDYYNGFAPRFIHDIVHLLDI